MLTHAARAVCMRSRETGEREGGAGGEWRRRWRASATRGRARDRERKGERGDGRTRHIGERERERVRQPQGGKASKGKGRLGRHGAVAAVVVRLLLLLPLSGREVEVHDPEMGLGEVNNRVGNRDGEKFSTHEI